MPLWAPYHRGTKMEVNSNQWNTMLRAGLGFCALWLLSSIAPAAAADNALSLVIGAPPGISDALDLVAQGAGFFAAEHLDITKNHSANAPTCAQLVASGKGDVCSMSIEPILLGYDKGLRLQAFLARSSSYSYMLAVPADSPIKTLEDFKGTDIGENSPGSAAEPAAVSMLAGAGLKKSDYTFVSIGSGAQAVDAIVSKKVAGLAEGASNIGTYQVVGNVKFRLFRHPLLKDVPNVVYAATAATIQTKADVLKRYSRAIVKAALFTRENPAAAARYYLQLQDGIGKVTEPALTNITRLLGQLNGYLPAADPSNPRIGYLPPRGIALYSQVLTDYGVTRQIVPVGEVVTDQFIAFANDFDHNAVIALARKMR